MKTVRKKRVPTASDLVALASRSDIASIGAVVARIMAIIRNPNSNANELRQVIEIDPPLSARLLRRANSASLGIKRNVTSIHESIVLLGFNSVREIAMSLKVAKLFDGGEGERAATRRLLWKHSLAVALCCKHLYRREFKERGDEIYTAALLHDIGVIVEDQFAWEFLSEALASLPKEGSPGSSQSLCEAERETFGFDHTELGCALVSNWRIPEELIKAIGWHHKPMESDPLWRKPASAIFAADCACRSRGIALDPKPSPDEEGKLASVLEELKTPAESFELIMEDVSKEIEDLESKGELYA